MPSTSIVGKNTSAFAPPACSFATSSSMLVNVEAAVRELTGGRPGLLACGEDLRRRGKRDCGAAVVLRRSHRLRP